MDELWKQYAPNLVEFQAEFFISIQETLAMLTVAGLFTVLFGLVLGIIHVVTKEGGILEQRWVHSIMDKIINIFRAIPFVILLAALIPLTRAIVGTALGVKGAIIPLVIGATPFFIRQVDMAFTDIDKGLIEAAQSMGMSPLEIILKVYLKEGIPALAKGTTITLVSLLGLTAMGGAVGGGGIGSFVIRYGHNRYMHDITYASVIVILILVSLIQGIGSYIVKKTTH